MANIQGRNMSEHLLTSKSVVLQFCVEFYIRNIVARRSEWPCGLRRRSAAARLLRLWVRIPPGAWMSIVSAVCCQVEVCDELITRPEESYRLWYFVWCDIETS